MKNWSSTFLAALNGSNDGTIPVWFMRQAGRYLPEYQAVRKDHDFRTMSHRPELICEVTVQPLRRYPMDAAILFSDILTCLEYMGAPFKFEEGGPVLSGAGPHALTGLTALNAQKDMAFVGSGIQKIKAEIGERPLIGFVGAPFTLASYLIEGGSSREFLKTRVFMLKEPRAFTRALDRLAENVGSYLKYQIECGVQAVQIFDSWGGFLSLEHYSEFVLPSVQKMIGIVKNAGVPILLYSQPTSHLLPALVQSGATALSVDWRVDIGEYAQRLKALGFSNIALQGNLDPIVTTLSWDQAKPYVDRVLDSAAEAKILNRYIFNVGHGVSPETRPDTIERIVEYVHAWRR